MDGPKLARPRRVIREFTSDRLADRLLAKALEQIASDRTPTRGQNCVQQIDFDLSKEPQLLEI